MPLLMGSDDDMQTGQIGGSGFHFSGKRIEGLEATEYTLATIAIDETGSVIDFADLLRQCLAACVDGCKLSPRSDNIMVRTLLFGSQYPKGVHEIHGFVPVNEIDPASYPKIQPNGWTTLNDAVFSSIGASNQYGADLRAQDYNANGILFVVTDGGENASTATQAMVQKELAATVREEKLESMISILIGVNTGDPRNKDERDRLQKVLEKYQKDTGIDKYIDAGDLTPSSAAKLAAFVSKSVSSQSQAIGTGGPSQTVAATI